MIYHYLYHLVLSYFHHSSFPLLMTFKHIMLFLLNIPNSLLHRTLSKSIQFSLTEAISCLHYNRTPSPLFLQ